MIIEEACLGICGFSQWFHKMELISNKTLLLCGEFIELCKITQFHIESSRVLENSCIL